MTQNQILDSIIQDRLAGKEIEPVRFSSLDRDTVVTLGLFVYSYPRELYGEIPQMVEQIVRELGNEKNQQAKD